MGHENVRPRRAMDIRNARLRRQHLLPFQQLLHRGLRVDEQLLFARRVSEPIPRLRPSEWIDRPGDFRWRIDCVLLSRRYVRPRSFDKRHEASKTHRIHADECSRLCMSIYQFTQCLSLLPGVARYLASCKLLFSMPAVAILVAKPDITGVLCSDRCQGRCPR